MKNLVYLILFTLVGATYAQSNFEKGMDKAFQLWNSDKMDEAENLFERIAKAEKDNWLPHYYIAQLNSLKSWNVKDENTLKMQLDKAQEHLDEAMLLSPNNPEILVMQGQIYTNWVAFDGRAYGMKYASKVTELYNKAYELAPNNPRVVMCKADWAMGSARYFGKDPKPFCNQLESSLALFQSFEPESKYHPKWGEMRAKNALKPCME